MRRVILIALCAFLIAPAFAQSAPRPGYASPPPAPKGALVIGAAEKGKTVSAAVGQPITIALLNNSAAGNEWQVAKKPDFLSAPDFKGGPARPPSGAGGPLRLGAETWATYTFTVKSAGSGELKLDQVTRGWDTLSSYAVTIDASDAPAAESVKDGE